MKRSRKFHAEDGICVNSSSLKRARERLLWTDTLRLSSIFSLSFLTWTLVIFDARSSLRVRAFSVNSPSNQRRVHFHGLSTSSAKLRLQTKRNSLALFDTETAVEGVATNVDLKKLSADISAHISGDRAVTESHRIGIADGMDIDVPRPTANGGYTHTSESKAKISQANKGKTAWNKGQKRSEDVKARIAAGVRAKNRERFLAKLAELGMTEDQYEQQKKRDRALKESERRARRTDKGGYRHTEETRQKISRILKEKYASGELDKPRSVDPSKVRRGFSHSEETRAKISASLRKRWATDPEYRATMMQKTVAGNTREEIRKKISETLRQKWQDPAFREQMLSRMGGHNSSHDHSHREKISVAMKAKWQDAEYRKKTLEAIAKQREAVTATRQKENVAVRSAKVPKRVQPKINRASPAVSPRSSSSRRSPSSPFAESRVHDAASSTRVNHHDDIPRLLHPRKAEQKNQEANKKTRRRKNPNDVTVSHTRSISLSENAIPTIRVNMDNEEKQPLSGLMMNGSSKPKGEKSGSVSRLREERPELYELLYGDDDSDGRSHLASVFALGDENLDDFDPYGLDDF